MCCAARVPVLVTVLPVNEFTPECPNGIVFTVSETAPFGSIVGRVVGTDRDHPPDSLEYSLEGGTGPAQPFSIDARTGECPALPLPHSSGTHGCLTAHTTPQVRSVWWGPSAPRGVLATG